MKKPVFIESYREFTKAYKRLMENVETELDVDETMLDELVEIVGSEEDVEQAAKEAYEELENSFEENEMEFKEEDTPEKLAISSMIVKLVEHGKLDPQQADDFLEKYL